MNFAFRTMERANQLPETSLKEAMAELSKKLGLFERVRHVCQSVEIPLPGVVVVGEQSAGKSSLLENISGIQFPQGAEHVHTDALCADVADRPDGARVFRRGVDGFQFCRCSLDVFRFFFWCGSLMHKA